MDFSVLFLFLLILLLFLFTKMKMLVIFIHVNFTSATNILDTVCNRFQIVPLFKKIPGRRVSASFQYNCANNGKGLKLGTKEADTT